MIDKGGANDNNSLIRVERRSCQSFLSLGSDFLNATLYQNCFYFKAFTLYKTYLITFLLIRKKLFTVFLWHLLEALINGTAKRTSRLTFLS